MRMVGGGVDKQPIRSYFKCVRVRVMGLCRQHIVSEFKFFKTLFAVFPRTTRQPLIMSALQRSYIQMLIMHSL